MGKMGISIFIKLKEELKKFRRNTLGKEDRIKICNKYNITSDEINYVIKYLEYELKKEKTLNH